MIEKLYFKLPILIQNIVVTLKNLLVYNYKYNYLPFINPLSKVQRKVLEDKFRINDNTNIEKLNAFIKYSKMHTDYYSQHSKLYPECGSILDFNNIPLLSKNVLKENTKSFYCDEISNYNHVKFKTSGTTGSPMTGYIKKKDLRNRYRIVLKTMCIAGFDITQPYARFIGKNIGDNKKVYRKDLIHNHYFFSIFNLSSKSIHKYHKALTDNKIQFIEGYPSTINNLVNLMREQNYIISSIKGVYVTAEKLSSLQQDNIEDFFGCKTFDYYGSTEQSIYIYRANDNKYYPSNKTGYLQVVNSEGYLAKPGEEGQMVITSFTSHFTPLIRYMIGDRCVVSEVTTLEDGSLDYILDEIIGRDEESFLTLDGRFVSRFSLVIKFLPTEIKGAQLYISELSNEIKVKYLAATNLDSYRFQEFVSKMNSFVGKGYVYRFEKVAYFSKNKLGKVRTVFIEKNEN